MNATGYEPDLIATWLVSHVAQQLRVQPQDIDTREPLTCYGLDSVQAISIVSALEEWLGCELSHDLLNSYSTIEALSQYLAQQTYTNKTTAPANTSSAPIPDKQPNLLQKISAYLFWGFVKLLYQQWFQIRCCGLENIPQDRPYLVAANHTSHLDGQAIAVALAKKGDRISILAAKDYFFDRPLKSWFCKTFLHMIPLERQGNFLEGMQECQQTLARRKPVLIFPEGTRSLTGKMQPFQPGLGWLALQLNAPILPVYIEGAYEALPKGKWFPRRHPIRIVIGQPLDVSPYKAKQGTVPNREICQAIVDEVQAEIAQLRDN
jgi:long-chain acyl-CoA synthetase